jgi:hypothetical protein
MRIRKITMIAMKKIALTIEPHELVPLPAERRGARATPAGKIVSVLKPCFCATVVM